MLARYTLMNKNTEVLDFEYDLDDHKVTRVFEVRNLQAAPFGIADRHGDVSKKELNYWWRSRAIPASRAQIERLLQNLDLQSTLVLAEKSYGLSLTDCYWINDVAAPQSWEDINFFDNDFSEDLGILTLGQDSASSSSPKPDYASINLTSPNSTLGGDLLKKWKIVNGKRVLLKAGYGFINQEPYNEVVATELHSRMIPEGEYVPYTLFEDNRRVYSACDNMLGPNEELVPAWDAIRNIKQPNNLSDMRFYVWRLEQLGLDPDATLRSLAQMFAADFVLANRDRHYRNFGIIRNVDSLKVTRLAPVFDTGSCLWSDVELLDAPIDYEYMAKPFKYNGMRPADQVKLFAGYYDWFAPSMLEGFADAAAEILSRNQNMPERRIEKIRKQIERNAEQLCMLAK
jgi:hypothetical protein